MLAYKLRIYNYYRRNCSETGGNACCDTGGRLQRCAAHHRQNLGLHIVLPLASKARIIYELNKRTSRWGKKGGKSRKLHWNGTFTCFVLVQLAQLKVLLSPLRLLCYYFLNLSCAGMTAIVQDSFIPCSWSDDRRSFIQIFHSFFFKLDKVSSIFLNPI